MDSQIPNEEPTSLEGGNGNTLGMTAVVRFAAFGNRELQGKVDTGATTSSLHASNIQVDKGRNSVTFQCSELSNNLITLELDGAQEVHSADAGGQTRPVVTMDVEIDGNLVKGAAFNLNDRSQMDIPVLIGQNILKAGNFMIDPNKDGVGEVPDHEDTIQPSRESQIKEAIKTLSENDVSLSEIISYLQSAAIYNK